MKKISVLAGCFILTVALLAGCSTMSGSFLGCGGTTVDPIVSDKPWSNNYNYEYTEYDVERVAAVTKEDGTSTYGDTVATGKYTTTMYTIACDIYSWELWDDLLTSNPRLSDYFGSALTQEDKLIRTPGAYGLLVTDYSLTYGSGEHSGQTDTIYSVVLFKNGSLEPAYSEKIVTLTTSDNSYSTLADYVNGVNRFTPKGGATVETSISTDGGSYDNELLYYVLRSSSSLTSGGSATLAMHNSVYTGLEDSESLRNMAFSVSTGDMEGIDPDKEWLVPTYFGENDVEYIESDYTDDDGSEHHKGYVLPVYAVIMQLNEQDRGTTRTLYYSATDFDYIGDTTSKVLLRTLDIETDENGRATFANIATISDYKMSSLM